MGVGAGSQVVGNVINLIIPNALKNGNFLVKLITSLAGVGGAILGIILFTIILKSITLPFDFMSKASMRKNSLLMEKMRPDLEKLQKQYAGDKQLYNQKMMALYKKNGYSMLGACLPTIITLVVFIIALSAFSTFSTIQTKRVYYSMAMEYNSVIYEGIYGDPTSDYGEYIEKNEDGSVIIYADKIFNADSSSLTEKGIKAVKGEEVTGETVNKYLSVTTDTGYILSRIYYTETNGEISFNTPQFEVLRNKINGFERSNGEVLTFDATQPETDGDALNYLKQVGAKRSGNEYREKQRDFRFLWIKNIWVADTSFAHPVESVKSVKNTGIKTAEEYSLLISDLSKEAKQPNGYFILVALSIISTLGMQLLTTKSQKAQMELQTVDGQGKGTQKIMTWMMPIMMGIFAFMYTSAFSIYLILSSVISILSTILINKVVERKFKKKYAHENTSTIRGRVYTPEPVVKEKKKKSKIRDDVGAHDFMSAKVKGKNKNKAGDTDTYHIQDSIKRRYK